MEGSNRAALRINHQYWYTVCNLDSEQHIPVTGNNAITSQRSCWQTILALQNPHYSRMSLAKRYQRCSFPLSCQFTKKSASISSNSLSFIRGRKPKIELVAAVRDREASQTRAKSMDDAWRFREIRGSNDFNFGTRTARRRFPEGYSRGHRQL
jgi:hypothetical protein